jgi:hypothetical protein
MAHRTGFTAQTLAKHVSNAGFPSFAGKRHADDATLWMVASKSEMAPEDLKLLAVTYFPPPPATTA